VLFQARLKDEERFKRRHKRNPSLSLFKTLKHLLVPCYSFGIKRATSEEASKIATNVRKDSSTPRLPGDFVISAISVKAQIMTRHRNNSSRILQSISILLLLAVSHLSSAQSTVSCSVCGSGMVVGSPSNKLQDPFGSSVVSCSHIDSLGKSSYYTSLECAAIQFSVYANCNCTSGSTATTSSPATSATTSSPTQAASPTSAPTITATTNAPTKATNAPTSVPTTNSPTANPTFTASTSRPSPSLTQIPAHETSTTSAPSVALNDLPTVSGKVVVNLHAVSGVMPATTIAAYEQQMTLFFTDVLKQALPPVLNVKATLLQQVYASSSKSNNNGRRKRKFRFLQSNLSLETTLQVTGRRNTLDGKNGTIDSLLIQTVDDNAKTLVRKYLHKVSPAINQIYFKPVYSVSATQVPTQTQTLAPTKSTSHTSRNKGLPIGAVAAIILVGFFISAAFICFIWYNQIGKDHLSQAKSEDRSQRRLSEPSLSLSDRTDDVYNAVNGEQYKANGAVEKPLASNKVAPAATAARPLPPRQQSQPVPVPAPAEEESEDEGEEDIVTEPDDVTISDEHSVAVPSTTNKVTRQITAPAGKLGIVIDTTVEGPVIHKVNMLSPLEGLLKAGDIIVAINEVDTRAMGSSAITSLMIKTANQKRTLTVLTDE
jgi:hypothetical protein